MVAALNELEAGGYVARDPDPADRRRNVITVTAAGRRRAAELAGRGAEIQDELLAPLTVAERAQLTRLLGELLDHHRGRQGVPPLPRL
jgi:DNA-binding MarR family transcriptional regulator